jgi:hypothetical protein
VAEDIGFLLHQPADLQTKTFRREGMLRMRPVVVVDQLGCRIVSSLSTELASLACQESECASNRTGEVQSAAGSRVTLERDTLWLGDPAERRQ